MECSDVLLLHRLLDDDLDGAQAELVAFHVESCATCRAATKEAIELRTFVQDHLGEEDDAEDEATAATLAAISARMPTVRPQRLWRRSWIAAAIVGALALLLPLAVVSTVSAWPGEILEQAAARERTWKYRPHKILYWQVDTVARGVKDMADGQWRTVFWQKNGALTLSQVSRQFDPEGKTNYVYWLRPDGSSVRYRAQNGAVEITPSSQVARAALPALSPELRNALETYVSSRDLSRRLDVNARSDMQRLQRPVWNNNGTATFRRGVLGAWGDVYHITVVEERPARNAAIARIVHEYDVQSSTYRLLRLRSTVTYADGTTGVHDSRWGDFREITSAEFDAQTPRTLLQSDVVVHLTPVDIARRQLQQAPATASANRLDSSKGVSR